MNKYIKLSNGMKAIIDAEDWKKVKHFSWGFGYGHAKKSGYQQYVGAYKGNYQGSMMLHRFIMDTPKGFHTDHINGNHLDNRKSNLRVCSAQQNQWNSRKHIIQSSKYKGVSWYKRDKCWRAYANLNYQQIHLGYFKSEIEAAKVYNRKAKELYGAFAFLNSF
jgi:hypothetical protein